MRSSVLSSPQQILLGLLALGNINCRAHGSRKVVAELASALGDCNTFDFFFFGPTLQLALVVLCPSEEGRGPPLSVCGGREQGL